MAVTLKDIAREAGVTPSLVSKVLNGKATENRIKAETEELVFRKAKELNYKPNQLARGLRLKESKTIGMITPDISNPFFSGLTKTFHDELALAGYSIMIFDSNESTEEEKKAIDLFREKGVDGLIIIPVGTESIHLKEVYDDNFPLAIVYRTFDDLKANTVTVDNYNVILNVMEYLIENGHTKIGMIRGLNNISSSRERMQAYKKALKKHSIQFNENFVTGNDFTYSNGYLGANKLFSLSEPPTAIITMSEMITMGSFQAIAEKEKKVPEDVTIVSLDSMNFSKSSMVPVDSVSIPKELLASVTVKMILDGIKNKGKEQGKKVVLPCKINKYMSKT